jgi:CubicO group peptidase (beta-lactamase class C family)
MIGPALPQAGEKIMLRVAILAAALVCAATGPALAQLTPLPPQPADAPWPTREWAEGPLANDVNQATLDLAMTEAFSGVHPDLGETRAVLIVQGGRIVFERYGEGYAQNTRLISWSMAKSITHALVGAAALQERVDIDAPLGNPHWSATDPRAAITWRSFFTMTDGQAWSEINAEGVLDNDSALMLFGVGRRDTARFAAGQPIVNAVDTHWNYNSGGTVLITDALTRAIVPDPRDPTDRRNRMRDWMGQSLFNIIGMDPVVQFDSQGLAYGSSQIYATARDFGRFGLLYLRDGVWDGTRVLPEGWVDFARTPGPDAHTDIYGAHWWLSPAQGTGAPMRSLITDPNLADAFSAQGHEGQLTMVVPSKDLVIVRLGRFEDSTERWNALGDWMGRVAGAFGDRPAAP